MANAFEHELVRHGEIKSYTVSDPHPMFGKDPNILNELGHTKYPMYVDHPTDKEASGRFPARVVVQDEDEHRALVGKPKGKLQKSDDSWGGN